MTDRVAGEVAVPGDKSITHRVLMLAAVAQGESRLRGLLPSADCRSTAAVLRALGCAVPDLPEDGGEVRFRSRGIDGWRAPVQELDCGNSGTTARLMLGLLASRPYAAVLTGDESLRSRPMRRVAEPLGAMGAEFEYRQEAGRLPLRVRGGTLRALEYASPVSSAQVKSALLLAGLTAGVRVSITEPIPSRDHTERLLNGLGVGVTAGRAENGRWRVQLGPAARPLPPLDLRVPGDPSSAAFLAARALLATTGELCILGVGVNPTRTGWLAVLERMGAVVQQQNPRLVGGEPVADLLVRPAALGGVRIGGAEVPSLIDEVPVLAVLAARARGETVITDAAELRVKETDRISALVENLREIGVAAEARPDGLAVEGTDRPLRGRVRTYGDHRIAMAFGVLAALPGNRIEIDDAAAADVSFPGFWDRLRRISSTGLSSGRPDSPVGARWAVSSDSRGGASHGLIVAIDGPAGSGKSSTARAVAAELGYRHLDSGAFYRGLTVAALRAGLEPDVWNQLSPATLDGLQVRGEPAEHGFAITIAGQNAEPQIRSAEVNAHVSRMAAVPAVRDWLLGALRAAGRGGGLVADGRDIGTVVFPQADLKIFLTCETDERARRRLREQGETAASGPSVAEEAGRLTARDALDSSRAVAPLLRAADAITLDTTALPFHAQVAAIVRLCRARSRH